MALHSVDVYIDEEMKTVEVHDDASGQSFFMTYANALYVANFIKERVNGQVS